MPILRQIAQLGHPVLRSSAAPVNIPASAAVLALVDRHDGDDESR